MKSAGLAVRVSQTVLSVSYVVWMICAATGCRLSDSIQEHFKSEEDREFYREMAAQVTFSPEADDQPVELTNFESVDDQFEDPTNPLPPLPLPPIEDLESWLLTLPEAIEVALANNQIIRVNDQFLSSSNLLFGELPGVDSIYDPEIQASSTIGQRGGKVAETDFIPTVVSELNWSNEERIQNNFLTLGIPPGQVLDQDFGRFRTGIEKRLETGGLLSLDYNVNFDQNNVPIPPRLFSSAFDGSLGFKYNQPLWGGAGYEFTEIAGPVDLISKRSPSTDQGIVIGYLNNQISESEVQALIRQLVKDVSDVFWDLHLAHERYRVQQRLQSETKRVWESSRIKMEQGLGGGLADVAQAEESYLVADARVVAARSEIKLVENRLKRLLGVSVHDDRVIRPIISTDRTEFTEDWYSSLLAAFTNRFELKKVKLEIRSLNLQLDAAQNLINPRLDFLSDVHTNGFGNEFATDSDGTVVPDSFLNNLSQFDQVGWSVGFQFSMPLDRQVYRSLKRNLELRLMKANALLAAQEQEIEYELRHAFKTADQWSQLSSKYLIRMQAAARQVEALEAAIPTGQVSIDRLVRAQQTLATAETEYIQALTEFQKAINDIRYRRGTILEENRIHFAE